ncbi:MAG: hypothetical protein ACETWE_04265, partial [Candidatus Bathyarchaeia archaeon]
RRNNCAQVPRLVRWKNRLKLGEGLEVKVRSCGRASTCGSVLTVGSPFLRWSAEMLEAEKGGHFGGDAAGGCRGWGTRGREPQILCSTGFVCSSCNGSVNRNMLAS